MRGLVIACALAGCSGEGAHLHITSSATAIDQVELLISLEDCTTASGEPCKRVGWQTQLETPPSGEVFTLDDDHRFLVDVVNGSADIELHATSDTATPKRIALIGLANGQAVATQVLAYPTIPLHHGEDWKVDLAPVDPASDQVDGGPGQAQRDDRAHIWARVFKDGTDPDQFAHCAVLQHWDGDAWSTEYYAPKDDPDCDGEPMNLECDPLWFEYDPNPATSPPIVDKTPCLTMGPLDPVACTIGTSVCADGVRASDTCAQETSVPEYCVPDLMCECSRNPIDTTCIVEKIKEQVELGTTATMALATCGFDPDPATTNLEPCTSNSGNVAVLDLSAVAGITTCSDVGFRPPNAAGSLMSAPQPTLTNGDAMFAVQKLDSPCSIKVTWTAGGSLNNPGVTAVLDVAFLAGAKHVLLPIHLGFHDPNGGTTCPSTPTTGCTLFGHADNVFACSR